MSDPTEDAIQRALEQGRRNAAAMPLIKKHCAHAEIEPSPHHGWSMLEDMTGLPISTRIMRCDYAPAASMVGSDLLGNALQFYGDNCIECPHREMQGVPNLKMVADEEIAERERQREQREQAGEAERCARDERAAARAAKVAGEPEPTRYFVGLLDGLDADSPDERGEEFVHLCRLQPELCTPLAAEVLLEASVNFSSESLFEGLGHLDGARRVPRDRLLEAAVQALGRAALSRAAEIVVRLGNGLKSGQLRPALVSIMRLAAPPREFGPQPKGDLAPLRLAATNELPALLDELKAGIGSEDKYRRRVAAGAAQRLIEIEASVATVLVDPLIEALSLPESLSPYMGSPRESLLPALEAALIAEPERIAQVIERRAPEQEPAVQGALFHAFDGMVRRGGREIDPGCKGVAVAIDVAFRRLSGDWGEEVEGEAANLIELAARRNPEAMADRVDQLFGALLELTGTPQRAELTLELPPEVPPFMAQLEAHKQEMGRQATIRQLREALAALVPFAPEAIARNVFSVISAPDLVTEEGKKLRREAVQLLGDLGKRPEMLPQILPALYTALLHQDQGVRAAGVKAWGELAGVAHRELPADLGELLPRLLEDRYVIVHRAAITVLRFGLPVGEGQLGEVLAILIGWAETFKAGDASALEEVIDALWRLSPRLPEGPRESLREQCLRYAEHLGGYDKKNRVERWTGAARHLPSFPPRLIEVLADPERNLNSREDRLFRELRELPAEVIAGSAAEIAEAARKHLPEDTWEASRFVEVLQRAGLWKEASTLAEEILAVVPETVEKAQQREGLVAQLEACRAEAAIAVGDAEVATGALGMAAEAEERRRAAAESQRMPWELAE